MNNAIVEISLKDMALQEIGKVGAGIADLTAKYAGQVYEVSKGSGMDAAKAARLDIREKRYKIPHIVKEKKQELKKIGDDIQTEGDRIIGLLLDLEKPIDDQIKAEEERKAAIKAEKERIEKERVDGIRDRISRLQNLPLATVGMNADDMELFIARVDAQQIGADFQEFQQEAETAKDEVLEQLRKLHGEKAVSEEEAARIQQEQEEERQRLENERSENERKQKVQSLISEIRNFPAGCIGLPSDKIRELADERMLFYSLDSEAGREVYGESVEEAEQARVKALDQVNGMITAAEAQEKEKRRQQYEQYEREKEDARRRMINGLRTLPLEAFEADLSSARIKDLIAATERTGSNGDEELVEVIEKSLSTLRKMGMQKEQQEEQERLALEKEKQERQRQEEERLERERLENERIEKEREDKEAAELAERGRVAREKAEAEERVRLAALETVTILKSEYDQLCNDQALLDALRGAGVDNWEGWDFAIESMEDVA